MFWWYHKLAEFEGMSIKHRAGHKLYCADALSRRRQVKNDDMMCKMFINNRTS